MLKDNLIFEIALYIIKIIKTNFDLIIIYCI